MNLDGTTRARDYCNQLAAQLGLEPAGHATSFDDAVVVETPLPWKRRMVEVAGALPQELIDLRGLWLAEYHAGQPYRHQALMIAPDEHDLTPYTVAGYRRVLFYRRPSGTFAQFAKTEYLVPEGKVGALIWALYQQRQALPDFEPYRVPEADATRDILVCTHGAVDVVCAKFGYPLYRALRDTYANDQLRVWRVSHFGGHVFAPTLMDMPTGHFWAYVGTEQAAQIVTRTGDVAALRGHYRGWAGLPRGAAQAAELEMWQREGWVWFDYARCGVTLAQDADEEHCCGADVRVDFITPAGDRHAYEARVEVERMLDVIPSTASESTYPYAQYKITHLEKNTPKKKEVELQPMRFQNSMLTLLCLLTLLITGCTAPAAITGTGAAAAAASGEEHLIVHALGETIVPASPKRIVALEWSYIEDLLALGVQPVGVADIPGYHSWVKIPVALAPEVVDVGTRQEPNLETIAGLAPDLIIAPAFRVAETYDELSTIAPTLAFDTYPTDENSTQYDAMRQTFLTIADVLGRRAEGDAVLAQMEQTFANARSVLEANGATDKPFILAQAFGDDTVQIRLFTKNALAVQIMEQLGMKNGWDDGFQLYGFTTVSVETLPALGDLHFFYVVQDDNDVFARDAILPLWQSLEFVQREQAYALGGDTWLFGGPLSAAVLVDRVMNLLAADAMTTTTQGSAGIRVVTHAIGETQ